MQRTDEISARDEAFAKAKMNASALNQVKPKLKDDISFAWEISRIQSHENDELRKNYIAQFLIQESLNLFASLATVVVSGLIIAGIIVLPIPFLSAMIVGSLFVAISGFYALNKIVQHAKGYFKVTENIEASPTVTAESVIEGVDRVQLLPEAILRQTQTIAGESESHQLALVSKTRLPKI